MFGKFRATDFGKTGIIFDDGGFEDLTTVASVFEQEDFLVITQKIKGGSHASDTGANNGDVIKWGGVFVHEYIIA